MVVLQYTFTRPNTSVAFYSASGNASVVSAITAAEASGDIISFTDTVSADGLVKTRIINLPTEEALVRINSNFVLKNNKEVRTAYNNANGITETVSKSTV
jgi:hypothetical protein